jgi:hypothetical protein
MPVLPPPATLKFKTFSQQVTVRRPDGSTQDFDAEFHLEHFKVVDGGSGGGWRVIALLPDASRADVPLGSALLIGRSAPASILGEPA